MVMAQVKSRFSQISAARRMRKIHNLPVPKGAAAHLEPVRRGNLAVGEQLLQGKYTYLSQQFSLHAEDFWQSPWPNSFIYKNVQQFAWIDDLYAVNTVQSEQVMRDWVASWIKSHELMQKPKSWTLELVAWRLIRMVTFLPILLKSGHDVDRQRLLSSIALHSYWLEAELPRLSVAYFRILAIVAMIYSAIGLDGIKLNLKALIEELEDEADRILDKGDQFLPSRNPEELSMIFCLFSWAERALEKAELEPGMAFDQAIERLGQALRSLRLTNQSMIDAHGGAAQINEGVDRALAFSHVNGLNHADRIMGFAVVRAGNSILAFDAQTSPHGRDAKAAHASSLGIWVAHKNQPFIGSLGNGSALSLQSRLIAQETRSHSALELASSSSSIISPPSSDEGENALGGVMPSPSEVFGFGKSEDSDGILLEASQSGYQERFGLTHIRRMSIDHDGLFLSGVDILRADDDAALKRFEKAISHNPERGMAFSVRFHLGPLVAPSLDLNGKAVSLKMPDGQVWVFRQQGAKIDIEETQIQWQNQLEPQKTHSISIHSRLVGGSGYVSWSFQAF